jgi:hypothetical protein
MEGVQSHSVLKPGSVVQNYIVHLFQIQGVGMTGSDVQELTESNPTVPGCLERRDGGGVILREPNREDIDLEIEEQRIVEFYLM